MLAAYRGHEVHIFVHEVVKNRAGRVKLSLFKMEVNPDAVYARVQADAVEQRTVPADLLPKLLPGRRFQKTGETTEHLCGFFKLRP